MKFCYNTNFNLPKQSQRSRSVLQDGSRSLGLFWKEKTPSYNRRNTVLRPVDDTVSSYYPRAINIYVTRWCFGLSPKTLFRQNMNPRSITWKYKICIMPVEKKNGPVIAGPTRPRRPTDIGHAHSMQSRNFDNYGNRKEKTVNKLSMT